MTFSLSKTIKISLILAVIVLLFLEYWSIQLSCTSSFSYHLFGEYLFASTREEHLTMSGGRFSIIMAIIGTTLLVIMMLYSLRKRVHKARSWGALSSWLNFHILCGIFGSLFVFFHTNLNFRGLSGIAFLFMSISFISGFCGYYLFTSISNQLAKREDSNQALGPTQLYTVNEIAGYPIFQYRYKFLPTFFIEVFSKKLLRSLFCFSILKKIFSFWHIFHVQFGILFFLLTIAHIFSSIFFSVSN